MERLRAAVKTGMQYNLKKTSADWMIKTEQVDPQEQDSNLSVEYEYLTSKTYEELLASHELARLFVAQLGPLRDTPLPRSLAGYVREAKFSSWSCEGVAELMEARLNKMIKNNRLKKNWSEDDLQILVWLVGKFMEKHLLDSHESLTKEHWQEIAAMIPGATARTCMFKFVSLRKFKLAHHKWQKDEETVLMRIISSSGTDNWKAIAERLYEENPKKRIFRTAKQCREHWSCYLNPAIKKGPWEREEDRKLLQIVLDSNCLKKWSLIKQQFQGRTENALKNRYNLLLEKQKKLTPLASEMQLILENLKQDREETNDQLRRTPDDPRLQPPPAIPQPLPVQDRPILPLPMPSGFLVFFSNAENAGFQSAPMNTWFFQL